MDKLIPFIECRKIGDTKYECSVTIVYNDHYVKFNEGTFETVELCLDRCAKKAAEWVKEGANFNFFNNSK